MKSMYTSVIKYTRLKMYGWPDRLIPSRVSWFHTPVRFWTGKAWEYKTVLQRHERPLTVEFVFGGHAEYIANLICPREEAA